MCIGRGKYLVKGLRTACYGIVNLIDVILPHNTFASRLFDGWQKHAAAVLVRLCSCGSLQHNERARGSAIIESTNLRHGAYLAH